MTVPRFLADHDLRREIVRATRRLEPVLEFTTALDLGLATATDDEVLDYASVQGWLVVSHDVNTMKAYGESRIRDGRGMNGLFLVPQSRATRSIAESIVLIWSASQAEEWKDKIQYLPL